MAIRVTPDEPLDGIFTFTPLRIDDLDEAGRLVNPEVVLIMLHRYSHNQQLNKGTTTGMRFLEMHGVHLPVFPYTDGNIRTREGKVVVKGVTDRPTEVLAIAREALEPGMIIAHPRMCSMFAVVARNEEGMFVYCPYVNYPKVPYDRLSLEAGELVHVLAESGAYVLK